MKPTIDWVAVLIVGCAVVVALLAAFVGATWAEPLLYPQVVLA